MEWHRRLQEYVIMVYQKSSLLVTDYEQNRLSQHSLFTSSSITLVNKMEKLSSRHNTISSVFYRLMSTTSNDSSGWFALLFSCKLITASLGSHLTVPTLSRGFTSALMAATEELSIEEKKRSRLHSHQIIKLSWDDLNSILCVIKTSLSGRHFLQLSQLQIEKISVNILSAFLSSVDENKRKCSIIYRQSAGLPIENMVVLENSLLMDIPIPHALQYAEVGRCQNSLINGTCKDLIVAIFENSLEISEFPNFSFEVNEHGTDEKAFCQTEIDSIKTLEYRIMENIAAIFIRSKVSLVACQRRIHPYLIRILQRSGVICLARLSIRFCGALQRMCGARQLLSFPISKTANTLIEPESLGYLASLRYQVIYGRKYVVACAKVGNTEVEEDYDGYNNYEHMRLTALLDSQSADEIEHRKSPMSTVVITSPSEALCGELQAALENITVDLTTLLGCPYVIPGAGLWQAYTAKRVREMLIPIAPSSNGCNGCSEFLSIGRTGDIRKAAEIFIKCLEESSRIIGGFGDVSQLGRGKDDEDLNYTLPDHGVEGDGQPILFYNPKKDCSVHSSPADRHIYRPDEVSQGNYQERKENESAILVADSLELLVPNLKALQLAVDTAICMLDLDGIMISYPLEVAKNYP